MVFLQNQFRCPPIGSSKDLKDLKDIKDPILLQLRQLLDLPPGVSVVAKWVSSIGQPELLYTVALDRQSISSRLIFLAGVKWSCLRNY